MYDHTKSHLAASTTLSLSCAFLASLASLASLTLLLSSLRPGGLSMHSLPRKTSSACHSPATTILQRLPFPSDYHSPATTIPQRLPFPSDYHSPAPTISPATFSLL